MPCEKIEGRRAEMIDYTRKVIISEEEFNKKIQHRIECVKTNGGKKWITYTYPAGHNRNRIFANDSPIFLTNRDSCK